MELCTHCGEEEAHELHHDTSYTLGMDHSTHTDACNYDASWEGEERGYVATMDCHEYEAGCFCGGRNKCDWCIEQLITMVDCMEAE